MHPTRAAALAALLAAAAPLAACKRDLPPAVAVFARGSDAESLDPQGIDDGESAKVIDNLFEGLVGFSDGGVDIVPVLASSWTRSDDGLDWEFTLKPGVKFHDGTALDAEAVAFTLRRLVDPAHPHRPPKVPYGSFYSEVIERVEAAGPSTVKFRLKRPYAPFLANLAMFSAGIVSPAAVAAGATPAEPNGARAFAKKPVGTGPFRLVAWAEGEKKITLERNPDWHGPAPALERLVFTTIPNSNARLSALRSGQCNWMDGLLPEDLAGVEADPTLKAWTATGFNVGYLALNTTRKPFDDARVRRAVALAVDRNRIADALFHGFGVAALHPVPPGIPGHDGAPVPPPDREKAKALLREAGFPDGFDTELYAMTNPRPYFPSPDKVAVALAADLREVGIRARIETVGDWPAYRDAVSNAKHPMCLMGWTTDNGDADNFLSTFFARENAVPGPGALNLAFWTDPRMQDLLRRQQEQADPAARAPIVKACLDLVREEVPMLPLAHMRQVFVSRAGFEGFVIQPTGNVYMRGVRAPAR